MRLIKLLLIGCLLNASQITLNFKDLEIEDFIKMVAKITDKNILVTSKIKGKVNFISVKPVNEKEIYSLLVNVLRSKGYTLIEENGFLKVVRSAEAPKNAPPLAYENSLYQIQTDIIRLKNIQASTAFSQVSYLLSRYGKIVVNKDKNLLIITDYPRNLKLIKNILYSIDKKSENILKIVEIKNADINRIYSKLNEISSTLFDKKLFKYKVIIDTNSNSLILVGPSKVVEKLEKIVTSLDKKPKPINQTAAVITLKNTDVAQIEKILQQLVKSELVKKNTKTNISITSDKETNAIIVLAAPEQIAIIKDLINKLDIPKMQVYVKAKILEISNSKASQLGAKLGLIGGSATTSGIYTLSTNLGGAPLAFNIGDLGLSMPTIQEGLALGAVLDLLEVYGAAKKLSEPSILCINNTPSTIYVGKTVSVLTGKTTSQVTSESYARQDIGLTLKVTPRIDSDDKVTLNVTTNIEDILPGSPVGLPTTSKREIKTTTIVKNGQSIIIGGLVKNNNDVTFNKVPLLGDIPVFGTIFKHKNINKDKTTLVILLTPYIIKKSDDLEKLRQILAKLDRLEKEFVEKIKKEKLSKD